MSKDYPTNLQVGDVLISNTGRTYTVTNVSKPTGEVQYAFVPVASKDGRVVVHQRNVKELHWVRRVENTAGQRIWPPRAPQKGDEVRYDGQTWRVEGSHYDGLTLVRTVRKHKVNKSSVEVL